MSTHPYRDPLHDFAQHIVIDIETMGVRPGAAICSIGAACIRREILIGPTVGRFKLLPYTFYRRLKPDRQYSTLMEGKTQEFWTTKASRKALVEAFRAEPRIEYVQALVELLQWIHDKRKYCSTFIWGNSPDFDLFHLKELFERASLDEPWEYHEVRDIRTALSLHPVSIPRRTTRHIAHLDAEHEARQLAEVLNQLLKGRPNA